MSKRPNAYRCPECGKMKEAGLYVRMLYCRPGEAIKICFPCAQGLELAEIQI
jgi:hypothetical protein